MYSTESRQLNRAARCSPEDAYFFSPCEARANPPFKTDFSTTRDRIERTWSDTNRFFAGIPKIPNAKKDSMAIYLMFIQHAMYSLKDSGKAAIVVPTGFVTAKSGIEMAIRTKMVEEKMLTGVVQMPSNIFANTGTNVSVIFLDKANKHDDVILIDASKLGEKVKDGKNQRTVLHENEVQQIIKTFINREEVEDFSVIVPFDGLKEKNYSFSAGQYFEVKIQYADISADEFQKRMNTYVTLLSQQFRRGKELEDSIMKQMGGLEHAED